MSSYLEDMIIQFLKKKLTDDEKKQIYSSYDCEKEIDEETENEMMEDLYKYVITNVRWWKIIDQVKADLESDDEENESDND